MPRNSSGVYSKPAGTTAVTNTPVDPTPWNGLTTDLGNEITNSLPRDGSAPMLAQLKNIDGTQAQPSVTFSSDVTTGFYRQSTGAVSFVVGGAEITNWSGTGFAVTGALSASGAATFGTIAGEPMRGALYGLTLANNSGNAANAIDIAVGNAAGDGLTPYVIQLTSGITKRLDAAWSVGTNNGGLDAGSVTNATYHVWLIQRSDTGVVDALFSLSATSPTMPTSYDQKRRIGSIVRLSAAIIPFVQNGDYFGWKTPIADLNVSNPGAAAVIRTLTVPTGIIVNVKISLFMRGSGSGSGLLVSNLAANDVAADQISNFSLVAGASTTSATLATEFTNTSGQIRTRLENSDSNSLIRIATLGYTDTRGRV